jgi:hypothetical protein
MSRYYFEELEDTMPITCGYFTQPTSLEPGQTAPFKLTAGYGDNLPVDEIASIKLVLNCILAELTAKLCSMTLYFNTSHTIIIIIAAHSVPRNFDSTTTAATAADPRSTHF